MSRTKVVATIGPASDDPATLTALVEAGMDVARLGLAHGTPDEHVAMVATIREVAKAAGRPVGVLVDLPGPKVRAGEFPEGGVDLLAGSQVRLVPGERPSDAECIVVEYPTLVEDVEPGDHVVLGDGSVLLRIEVEDGRGLCALVIHGGHLQGRPGVHLPAEKVRLSTPTDDDLELIEAIRPAGPDFVAVSFVREADDVVRTREAIGGGPMMVAKIETRAAVGHLDEIIDVADAVMVARGDLALECDLEEVPHLQKRIIRACVERGRPVITATQMLESMVYAPSPTRAEVSDVANAVFDGTDALMLSGETAIGHDPVAALTAMARIASRAEQERSGYAVMGRAGRRRSDLTLADAPGITAAMTQAAWQAASEAGVTAILCCTRSGNTARSMARFRPEATLVALTPDDVTRSQLTLTWGAVPLVMPTYSTTDEMVDNAVVTARAAGTVSPGDVVAVLAGNPAALEPATDVLRLVRVT